MKRMLQIALAAIVLCAATAVGPCPAIAATPVTTAVYAPDDAAVDVTPVRYYRPYRAYYRPYYAYRPYVYRPYVYRPYYTYYGYRAYPYYGYRAYPYYGYYGRPGFSFSFGW